LGVPRIRPDAGFGLYENDEDNRLYAGYFSLPFENIWTMRKMKALKDEESPARWILDNIIGENDTFA
jgi:hypothetical protein